MQGLSEKEVQALQKRVGKNTLSINDTKRVPGIIRDIVKEPMFLLLVAAGILYFILGERTEGFMMTAALLLVVAISLYQEMKSSNALNALRQLTEPKASVIREGVEKTISIEELVPGDIILLEEGERIPADAEVIEANDLSVNESIITGESMPVEKTANVASNALYQGTVLNSGRCTARITATGNQTVLGKIGRSIATYSANKTELQKQVDVFVKRLALFGIIAFVVIFLVNYWQTQNVVMSLLFGLTLAMSAIPEEIPVAFSSFMALGAYYMSKLGIISRQPQTIENLGAVNIICLDKTGTITENKMKVDAVYDFGMNQTMNLSHHLASKSDVIFYAVLASEKYPFDVMEQAIVAAADYIKLPIPKMEIMAEYALHGNPPMMTHVYQTESGRLAAAKGAVERIIRICKLTINQELAILEVTKAMASKGCRVLGVARALPATGEDLPKEQDDFDWQFKGLMSFYDPPKPYVKDVFQQFYEAGISIKILTGDFSETVISIANETGIKHSAKHVTGEEIMTMSQEELQNTVNNTELFTRMYPDAKLKVVQALINAGNIVAMTGDGVNDAPALKTASIGIAMGKGGTEVARQSADLIITDDDLRKLIDAIQHGRKIFANIKKAIRYIISIHIPIILTAALPLLFGWKHPNVFTPIHVIFLELIMGPTCSIFFEREPVEKTIMKMVPRKKEAWLFAKDELLISITQGLVITGGLLSLYYFFMIQEASLPTIRAIVFTTLIMSNILLTFTNRSFTETFLQTAHYKNNLAFPIIVLSILFMVVIHVVPFVREQFGINVLSMKQLLICMVTAVVSVGWFEVYKSGLRS